MGICPDSLVIHLLAEVPSFPQDWWPMSHVTRDTCMMEAKDSGGAGHWSRDAHLMSHTLDMCRATSRLREPGPLKTNTEGAQGAFAP